MARTHRFRFLIELELQHAGGKLASQAELEKLMIEALTEAVGVDETFCVGQVTAKRSEPAAYTVSAAKTAPIDEVMARRLVG